MRVHNKGAKTAALALLQSAFAEEEAFVVVRRTKAGTDLQTSANMAALGSFALTLLKTMADNEQLVMDCECETCRKAFEAGRAALETYRRVYEGGQVH